MFSWPYFSQIALESLGDDQSGDTELVSLLKSPSVPNTTDVAGSPLPNSAVINQHPEPDNFKWIVNARRSASITEGDEGYIHYADQVLGFFDSFGPFSESNPLFIIFVSTHKNKYEFLFSKTKRVVIAITVGNLGKH
jgi:hypothetical protein